MRTLSSLLVLLCLALLALASVPGAFAASRDFYKILGVARNANDRAIKKSYLKLAKIHHPDQATGDKEAANKKFQDIAVAYETLSDKEKRRTYDRGGEEALAQQKQQQQQGGGMDIFSQMFGGGRQQPAEERRGEDIQLDLPVTLEELYKGRVFEVSVRQQHLCSSCRGTGARKESDVQQCPHCQGKGSVIKMHSIGPGFMQQVQQPCDRCHGKGKLIKHVCPACSGKKVERGEKKLDIHLEAGMVDGAKIEFEHAADEHPDHAAGHVVFTVRTAPHPRFERRGHDLHTTVTLSLREALVGFSRQLAHLDGHLVTLTSRPGAVVAHGDVARISGEGMPHHNAASQRGDLLVRYEIAFPNTLDKAQKEALAKIL